MFYNIGYMCRCYNTSFSSSMTERQNKQQCLPWVFSTLFSYLWVRLGITLRCSTWAWLRPCSLMSYPPEKNLLRANALAYFCLPSVEKFCNVNTWLARKASVKAAWRYKHNKQVNFVKPERAKISGDPFPLFTKIIFIIKELSLPK